MSAPLVIDDTGCTYFVNFIKCSQTQLMSAQPLLHKVVKGKLRALKPVSYVPLGTRTRLKDGKNRKSIKISLKHV